MGEPGGQRLEDRHAGEHLGIGLGQDARGRGRRRRAPDGHGDEAGGHARVGVDKGRLERSAFELQGAEAHLERGQDRAGPERIRTPGDGPRELDRTTGREGGDRSHQLDVLPAVRELGPELVQRTNRHGPVTGLHALPEERDLRQRVGEPRHLHQVRLRGGAPEAGVEVEDLGGAAVDGQVSVCAVEMKIPGGIPSGQRVRPRSNPERGFDQRGRQADAVAVDPGSGRREAVADPGRANHDARLGKDPQARGMEPGQPVGRERTEDRLPDRERTDGRRGIRHVGRPPG